MGYLLQSSSFSGGLESKEATWNAGDLALVSGLGTSPEEGWQPTPVFLPGESHGQRSLVGYSPWGRKESDTTEQLILSLQTWEILNKSNTHKNRRWL